MSRLWLMFIAAAWVEKAMKPRFHPGLGCSHRTFHFTHGLFAHTPRDESSVPEKRLVSTAFWETFSSFS